jgi:hypothetical protein
MSKSRTVFRCLISGFLVIMFMIILASTVTAQTPIEDARKGVVRIVTYAPDGLYMGSGSGFVIGVNEPFEYVATNFHVVDSAGSGYNYFIVFVALASDDLVPVTIYQALPDTDIALLKIDPDHLLYGFEPLSLATKDMVSIGQDVYAIGFPGAALGDYFRSYYTDTTVTKGIISKETTDFGRSVYQTDAPINPGNSGGPLVNTQGQVVGINTFYKPDAQAIYGAVQIDYLVEVLDRRGIAYKKAGAVSTDPVPTGGEDTTSDGETPPPPVQVAKGPNYLLYGGIGLGILVLIGAVALVVSNKKGSAGSTPGPVASASGQFAPPPLPEVTSPFRDEPVTSAKTSAAPAVTQAKISVPKPVLKGISGRFAGQTVEMVDGQIVIGRDPRLAQLVYPQGSEEISRKHCTIRFDKNTGKFEITDSSSNGTYLSSNDKLEQGKPRQLNAGDRFYLADPKEVFEVRVD